jgi:hypothetical protein
MDNQLILCSCHSPEHQMILLASPDKSEVLCYVCIHLVKRPLWYRIKYGLKYIFGYKSRYGAWDELLLDSSHATQLQNVVNYLNQKSHK